jgi:hypothetical protein
MTLIFIHSDIDCGASGGDYFHAAWPGVEDLSVTPVTGGPRDFRNKILSWRCDEARHST